MELYANELVLGFTAARQHKAEIKVIQKFAQDIMRCRYVDGLDLLDMPQQDKDAMYVEYMKAKLANNNAKVSLMRDNMAQSIFEMI